MMATMQSPLSQNMQQIEQAKKRLIDYMNHYQVTVEAIQKMGDLGMKVLKNKKLYPKFVEQARELRIPGADKLSEEPDFQQIGNVIALSRLLER
jgi:hypothetical protein